MEVIEFLIYCFALLGLYVLLNMIWYYTSNWRYNFKLKYILKPKFKKGDYVLAPDKNNKPFLVKIESVSSDWKEKRVEYTVYPMKFPNRYIDYGYFEQLVFTEKSLLEISDYYEFMWEKMFNEE